MKLIFYYDCRDALGGVTSLYITMLERLITEGRPFVFFSYKGGVVDRELRKKGLELDVIDIEAFDWSGLSGIVQPEDVIVTTSFYEYLVRFMDINPKVLYYVVHEFIDRVSEYKFGYNPREYGRKLISLLNNSDALLLMDDTGIRNSEERLQYVIHKPRFLPIPVQVPPQIAYRGLVGGALRLSYIGRSVDWKMMPLKKILEDVKQYVRLSGQPVRFTIAVDSLTNMRQFIQPDEYNMPGLEVITFEKIPPSELPAFLLENSDIGFAMGTAALEYAKLGIPTLLMDFSHTEMPENYRYQWLYQTKDYCLGKNVRDATYQESDGADLASLLGKEGPEPAVLMDHSRKSYEYTRISHDVANFVSALYSYAAASRVRMQDVRPYNMYYWKFHQLLRKLVRRKAS